MESSDKLKRKIDNTPLKRRIAFKNDSLSNNLKEIRTKKGLSQKKVAEMIGSSQTAINYWEKGERKPKFEQIIKLAEALEVNVDDLFSSSASESTTRTMHDYMDMKGKPLTEYFDSWLKVCEIEWDVVERKGVKGRLVHFEGLEEINNAEELFFVTEKQFQQIRAMTKDYTKKLIKDYGEINKELN